MLIINGLMPVAQGAATATLAATVVFFSVSGAAAQVSDCAVALVRDQGELDMRRAQSLAQAEMIYRSSERSKQWEGSIRVPIKGVPVGGNAQSAESARDAYFSQSNLNWTDDRVVSVATQTLSRNSVETYRTCIDGIQTYGVRILAHDAQEDEVTITIRWIGAAGSGATTGDVNFSGGAVTTPITGSWRNGESRGYIVKRDPSRDLRIVANIGGATDNIFLSRWPPPPIYSAPEPVLVIAKCVGRGGQEGVWMWGPKDLACNGLSPPAWGPYDGDPTVVTALGSCIGHGGFEGVRLWGPPGKTCGGIPAWGTYSDPVNLVGRGIASCMHHGNILEHHRFWGPQGEYCGGIEVWGEYSQFGMASNASR